VFVITRYLFASADSIRLCILTALFSHQLSHQQNISFVKST